MDDRIRFEEWLRSWDRIFPAKKRRVLMIIDNCPAHFQVDNLMAIKLVFLPPNITSHLHPMYQGIIANFKTILQTFSYKAASSSRLWRSLYL